MPLLKTKTKGQRTFKLVVMIIATPILFVLHHAFIGGALYGLGWLACEITGTAVGSSGEYLLYGLVVIVSSPLWLGLGVGPVIWMVYLLVVGGINGYRYIRYDKPKYIKPVSYFGGDGPCYPGGIPF